MTDTIIRQLQQKLLLPLPGRKAQFKMAHVTRSRYVNAPPGARQASVLATLFPKNSEWHMVLIERNANDRDHHGGQISFPGGKVEPEDKTLLHTALRETEEEVGILQTEVNVIGQLSDLYIPVSNFQVHPFVGYLQDPPSYTIQEEEVRRVIEVPVRYFSEETYRRTTDIPVSRNLLLKNVPYYDIDGKVLWGATAMIISELMEILHDEMSQ